MTDQQVCKSAFVVIMLLWLVSLTDKEESCRSKHMLSEKQKYGHMQVCLILLSSQIHTYAETIEVVGREMERSAKQSDNRLCGEK